MLDLDHHQINYVIHLKNTKINIFEIGNKLSRFQKKQLTTNYLVSIRGGSRKKIEKKIIPNVLINKNV
jgi:hypothetical protein